MNAFEHLIPDDVANRLRARRHLAAMSTERRAALEAEWLAAEDAVSSVCEPISAETKARANAEWETAETEMGAALAALENGNV